MIESAVDEGYNVIVMPGYAFGGAIAEAAPHVSPMSSSSRWTSQG